MQSHHHPQGHFLLWAPQVGRDNAWKCLLLSFAHADTNSPLCLTCNISRHLPPPSILTLNDTVYTHPASLIPFHTSSGLFICLRLWGDMKAHTFSSALSIPLLPFLSSNHYWQLMATDIRGLIKPLWFCLIYAGEYGWEVRKCSKDWSHLLQHLSYSPGAGKDAAGGTFFQLLHLAPSFCWGWWCLCLVINVCCVRGKKNKCCRGIGASQRVRLEDLYSDQWQAYLRCLRIQHVSA